MTRAARLLGMRGPGGRCRSALSLGLPHDEADDGHQCPFADGAGTPLCAPVSDYFPGFSIMKVAVRRSATQTDLQRVPICIQDVLRHNFGPT